MIDDCCFVAVNDSFPKGRIQLYGGDVKERNCVIPRQQGLSSSIG